MQHGVGVLRDSSSRDVHCLFSTLPANISRGALIDSQDILDLFSIKRGEARGFYLGLEGLTTTLRKIVRDKLTNTDGKFVSKDELVSRVSSLYAVILDASDGVESSKLSFSEQSSKWGIVFAREHESSVANIFYADDGRFKLQEDLMYIATPAAGSETKAEGSVSKQRQYALDLVLFMLFAEINKFVLEQALADTKLYPIDYAELSVKASSSLPGVRSFVNGEFDVLDVFASAKDGSEASTIYHDIFTKLCSSLRVTNYNAISLLICRSENEEFYLKHKNRLMVFAQNELQRSQLARLESNAAIGSSARFRGDTDGHVAETFRRDIFNTWRERCRNANRKKMLDNFFATRIASRFLGYKTSATIGKTGFQALQYQLLKLWYLSTEMGKVENTFEIRQQQITVLLAVIYKSGELTECEYAEISGCNTRTLAEDYAEYKKIAVKFRAGFAKLLNDKEFLKSNLELPVSAWFANWYLDLPGVKLRLVNLFLDIYRDAAVQILDSGRLSAVKPNSKINNFILCMNKEQFQHVRSQALKKINYADYKPIGFWGGLIRYIGYTIHLTVKFIMETWHTVKGAAPMFSQVKGWFIAARSASGSLMKFVTMLGRLFMFFGLAVAWYYELSKRLLQLSFHTTMVPIDLLLSITLGYNVPWISLNLIHFSQIVVCLKMLMYDIPEAVGFVLTHGVRFLMFSGFASLYVVLRDVINPDSKDGYVRLGDSNASFPAPAPTHALTTATAMKPSAPVPEREGLDDIDLGGREAKAGARVQAN